MRIYDIIDKKRNKSELSKEEIKFFVDEYVKGNIEDYQISALFMAICINGMNDEEVFELTRAMLDSGEIIDLSSIPGLKVDKHSTGGVGDKTTLIVLPIVAACGGKIAKMSGRGLGYTGGTIDKLESIPGFKVSLTKDKFFNTIRKIGVSITNQSGNLVPADKKFYALRDVTATVESIPLIASSIMSKKLALGSDCILLDVKTGKGAFMKDLESSLDLAKSMVKIGAYFKKETVAIITDMNEPLGFSIGNSLEVIEVCEVLKGRGPKDLENLSVYLSANMLNMLGMGTLDYCENMARRAIENGTAFLKLKEIVREQGGNDEVLDDYGKFKNASCKKEIICTKSGYINKIDAEKCGVASVALGAGRQKKNEEIDLSAGIVLNKKVGDYTKPGEIIAKVYSSDEGKCLEGEKIINEAVNIGPIKPEMPKLIKARVTDKNVEIF